MSNDKADAIARWLMCSAICGAAMILIVLLALAAKNVTGP